MTVRERRSASACCKENIFSFQRCHKSLLDRSAVTGLLTRHLWGAAEASEWEGCRFISYSGRRQVRVRVACSSSPCCDSSPTLCFLLNLARVPLTQQLPGGIWSVADILGLLLQLGITSLTCQPVATLAFLLLLCHHTQNERPPLFNLQSGGSWGFVDIKVNLLCEFNRKPSLHIPYWQWWNRVLL